jgi:hypothetical protein
MYRALVQLSQVEASARTLPLSPPMTRLGAGEDEKIAADLRV